MDQTTWGLLTYEEKQCELFERQKKLLETFFEHRAITKEQYEKSLGDLKEKMVFSDKRLERLH